MLGHGIAPNRSTESLHLLERLQHAVPGAFRRMPLLVAARGLEAEITS